MYSVRKVISETWTGAVSFEERLMNIIIIICIRILLMHFSCTCAPSLSY